MTAVTPIEYQKRALARERHEREVTSLVNFVTWARYQVGDISDLETENLNNLAECFIRAKEANRHV